MARKLLRDLYSGDYSRRTAVNSWLRSRPCTSGCLGNGLGTDPRLGRLDAPSPSTRTPTARVSRPGKHRDSRNSGTKWHGSINCLNVVGNVATMAGLSPISLQA